MGTLGREEEIPAVRATWWCFHSNVDVTAPNSTSKNG